MTVKAKITDVARVAGVSVTTVSHTLSGRRPVGEEVRGRVLRAIRELNYRPNYFAGAMKQNRTGLIGILVDQCRNAATGILLEGMEQALAGRGYEIVLGIAGLDPAKGRRLLEKFASGMVDGVINMLPQLSSDEAELIAPSLPLVTHLRQASAPVYVDYEEGARQAFAHLRGLGHRRIGYIGSARRKLNGLDPVLAGCRNFLSANGEELDPMLLADGDDTIEGGRRAAAILLQRHVTAIFAANDQTALGVYQRAYAEGRRIPEELSVVGYDDSPLATSVYPLLTSVQTPFGEIARYTAEGLLRKLDGENEPLQPRIITPQLIVRNSTAYPSLQS